MLKKITRKKALAAGAEHRFAIVASRYNAKYVDGLIRAARAELRKAGATAIEVIRVPGAYEIPVVAARLARGRGGPRPAAILCLGVILQGATAHARHIAEAITDALMRLQVETGVPCVHEVLSVEDEAQAAARCLSRDTNRGTEAAQTALAMAGILARFDGEIPF